MNKITSLLSSFLNLLYPWHSFDHSYPIHHTRVAKLWLSSQELLWLIIKNNVLYSWKMVYMDTNKMSYLPPFSSSSSLYILLKTSTPSLMLFFPFLFPYRFFFLNNSLSPVRGAHLYVGNGATLWIRGFTSVTTSSKKKKKSSVYPSSRNYQLPIVAQ